MRNGFARATGIGLLVSAVFGYVVARVFAYGNLMAGFTRSGPAPTTQEFYLKVLAIGSIPLLIAWIWCFLNMLTGAPRSSNKETEPKMKIGERF